MLSISQREIGRVDFENDKSSKKCRKKENEADLLWPVENRHEVGQRSSQNVNRHVTYTVHKLQTIIYSQEFGFSLGYNPCDYMDTMSNISKEWLQYLDGKITINDIIEAYESRGFDSNQDIPGNYHWEELYQALGPETKVILTVRDDTERKWFVISRYIIQYNLRKIYDI